MDHNYIRLWRAVIRQAFEDCSWAWLTKPSDGLRLACYGAQVSVDAVIKLAGKKATLAHQDAINASCDEVTAHLSALGTLYGS